MKTIKRILLLLLVLHSGMLSAQRGGILRVRVFDSRSTTALYFAQIKLYKGDRLIATVSSDSLGHYVFRNVAKGTYRVTTDLNGYAATETKNIRVTHKKDQTIQSPMYPLAKPKDPESKTVTPKKKSVKLVPKNE